MEASKQKGPALKREQTQRGSLPSGNEPRWSRENAQPAQAGATHPEATLKVDGSSRRFSAPNSLGPAPVGESSRCLEGGELRQLLGPREGAAPGWGRPATSADS